MKKVVRTVFGAALQSAMYQKLPMTILPHSTLNELYNILPDTLPDKTEYSAARYLAVGIGGQILSAGNNGRNRIDPSQHEPTDTGLWEHVPFVMRELSNDLSVTERSRYALRRVEEHNGVLYICYYLRRLDMTGVSTQLIYKTVTDGVVKTAPWVPTSDNLKPTPKALVPNGTNTTTGDYITATTPNKFILDENEITELLNVGNILLGGPEYMILTEAALVAGVDRTVPVTGGGNETFNFTEVIAAQCVNFIAVTYPLIMVNKFIEIDFDIGATEPMYNLAQD